MKRSQKIEVFLNKIAHNNDLCFDKLLSSISVSGVRHKHKINFDLPLHDLFNELNNFLFVEMQECKFKTDYVGNFSSFYVWKLRQLTQHSEHFFIHDNGEIDLISVNITIKIDMFDDLLNIINSVNKTIEDVNKKCKVKIEKIKTK